MYPYTFDRRDQPETPGAVLPAPLGVMRKRGRDHRVVTGFGEVLSKPSRKGSDAGRLGRVVLTNDEDLHR